MTNSRKDENEQMKRLFQKELENQMLNAVCGIFLGPDSEIEKKSTVIYGLDNILKNIYSPQQTPELSEDVIKAVTEYNTEEHRKTIATWLTNTKEKNAIDKEGNTILHLAVKSAKPNLTSWFLKNGLEINTCNKKHDSPLIVAVSEACKNQNNLNLRNKYITIIQELLKAGAKNIPDNKSTTAKSALGIAAGYNDQGITKILIDSGFKVNERDTMSPLEHAQNSTKRNENFIKFLDNCAKRSEVSSEKRNEM